MTWQERQSVSVALDEIRADFLKSLGRIPLHGAAEQKRSAEIVRREVVTGMINVSICELENRISGYTFEVALRHVSDFRRKTIGFLSAMSTPEMTSSEKWINYYRN